MASAADRARVVEAGFALYVTKPVDSAALIEAVRATAASEKARREAVATELPLEAAH
jgi:DNA-binding response OmpR family regulator